MPSLNLFPARVFIGKADSNGNVLMTVEFARAMSDLLERVGGTDGMSNNDLAVLESFSSPLPAVADLARQVEDLRQQIELMNQPVAQTYGPDFEIDYMFAQPPTDWEHPGKLGEQKPNTAKITVLNVDPANVGVVGFPALYFGTDTTTGLYRSGADQVALTVAGVNLVTWSSTGAQYTQSVTTNEQLVSTIATGTAPLSVASTTLVTNLHAEVADQLSSPTAFPADATDLASVITLANALKAAGISKGL